MGSVIARSQLEQLSRELKAARKTIVTTNGCFDLLHVGHVRILRAARELGDILVVGLNSDSSVKRLKGASRPINTQDDRAEVLSSLGCVDYVTVFDEDTPVEFLKLVKPDVHVKGADYKPENLSETPVVESFGGRVHIIELVPGRSTSSIVAKLSGK